MKLKRHIWRRSFCGAKAAAFARLKLDQKARRRGGVESWFFDAVDDAADVERETSKVRAASSWTLSMWSWRIRLRSGRASCSHIGRCGGARASRG